MCYFPIPATRKALERCCVNLTACMQCVTCMTSAFSALLCTVSSNEVKWSQQGNHHEQARLDSERLVQQMSLRYSGSVGLPITCGGLPLFVVQLFDVVRLIFLTFLLLPVSSLWFLSSLSSPSSFSFPSLLFRSLPLGDATQTQSRDPTRKSARQLWQSSAHWHGAPAWQPPHHSPFTSDWGPRHLMDDLSRDI